MKTRKKKYGGSELIQKQLDDCVKETKVLSVKLEMKNEDNKDYIKRNAELDIIIQQIHERLKITEEEAKITKEKLKITEEEAKITKEKLTKVSHNFLENRVITSLFEVMKYEKHGKENNATSTRPKNMAYQNIDQSKLKDTRNNIAHYFLEKIKQDIPRYQMYKKYLYEKIKKLQYEKSPIIEYINERIMDMSANILHEQIFDLKTFMSILETETASVSITPEVMTELDKWWQHGLI
jgi:hypothetical protein